MFILSFHATLVTFVGSSDSSCLISLQIVTFVNGLLTMFNSCKGIYNIFRLFRFINSHLGHCSHTTNGNNLQFTENTTYLLYTISECLLDCWFTIINEHKSPSRSNLKLIYLYSYIFSVIYRISLFLGW